MTTGEVVSRFPDGFLWGVSTSAFQIEGALEEDGRGPSVWDAFTAVPGNVKDGTTAATACDHYHRYREDVALIHDLGVVAYRFSIAWPRVVPEGTGPVNPAGLDFYDRLVDELCARGLEPVPTLFHWDTPLALEESHGGWRHRDTAAHFADYAAAVADRLGDRVTRWITLNEPAEHTLLGHALGQHAPGHTLVFDALPVAHHLLLGHGLAAEALRSASGEARIGIANSHGPVWPASDDHADKAAADLYDLLLNRLFADPLLLGRYPEGIAELMPAADLAADLKLIGRPLDWYGVNYYQPTKVAAPDGTSTDYAGLHLPADLPFTPRPIEDHPLTDFGWPVVPEALTELLLHLRTRYADRLPPLIITENGCSYPGLDDQERISFLRGHLHALHTAMQSGADVRGYFVWSLLDNFEWAEGHARRFGLVHVDYPTQRRTPKASYHWLRAALHAATDRP
ncbi:GH1 family beta-glucosidase [Streptomyces alkaliterrae]|uniref:Beta-glucosidase n=1 Tax=Streptomyces alkaliterrae TaxID=2213162 RepID=A0A5P0YXP7_9ACTN|nr:GH1 family beta-glucosidase [Streptomyces alkaliterrae]MBB1260200.1 beta-glucosidase [Streptomyces alkaliterrae]MQS05058.1 beta-glucosidase [Streptomyces alkaliterrae]